MGLKEKIQEDLKTALKAGNELERTTLRLLLSEIGKKEIELGKKEEGLGDEEITQVVLREIKKRNDATEQYRVGKREELAKQEEDEAVILQKYAPQQTSEDELKTLIDDTIKEVGAQGPADMGRVMKEVMAKVRGGADGSRVSALVKELLH